MANNPAKLLIVPGLKDSHKLAKDIHRILRDDYRLGEEGIELLLPKTRDEIPSSERKGQNSSLVVDFFPDMEVQTDIGQIGLEGIIRDKHVAIVQHLYNPVGIGSVNDRIAIVEGMLDLFGKTSTAHKSLVAPFSTYLRAHSVEKYEQRGFFQFDSLTRMLKKYKAFDLNTMISIDPHSVKVKEVALGLGMLFRDMNPFRSARSINPAKLGFSGDEGREVIMRLRPFLERFVQIKKENSHLYLVSADSGVEKRAEYFVDRAFPELDLPHIKLAYFGKDRGSYARSSAEFKSYSRINETNIDTEGTYIIIDDMFASGGTANKRAKILKDNGAKRVEVWTSHAVTSQEQVEKAMALKFIDKIVCLDTVQQDPRLGIEYINASADLLAAELYKCHEALQVKMGR
jgi:phosphoribosylpyrophosphate synthetase